jgi:hypothetical protein
MKMVTNMSGSYYNPVNVTCGVVVVSNDAWPYNVLCWVVNIYKKLQ